MNIIVTTRDGGFYSLDVTPDLEVENLVALVSVESGLPANMIKLSVNGIPMVDAKKTLQQYGIKGGDMLLLTQVTPAAPPSSSTRSKLPKIDWGSIQVPNSALSSGSGSSSILNRGQNLPTLAENAENYRQYLLTHRDDLAMVREYDPPLGAAVNNREEFLSVFSKRKESMQKARQEEQYLLTGDPMDPEYQRRLLMQVQGRQIEENLQQAVDEHPESFGQVIMLYINCEINGHQVKAFVDSGAQMTLISSACADRVNVSRLIDKRFQGVAKGVGTQKILGRVHLLPLKIGSDYFPCTFSVLENQPMEMLLGLDMLKRHQCVIDLKDNVLRIGTTGATAPFLAEHDIPKASDEERQQSTAGPVQPGPAQPPSTSVATNPPGASSENLNRAALNANIEKLVAMGVTPEAAERALRECGNNPEVAISMLFK